MRRIPHRITGYNWVLVTELMSRLTAEFEIPLSYFAGNSIFAAQMAFIAQGLE